MIEFDTLEEAQATGSNIFFIDGKYFVNPDLVDEPLVMKATKPQIRVALHRMGRLDDVVAAVYASDDQELIIWWEDQLEYHSDNAKVVAMGQLLSIDVQQLFELAQSITP